MRPALILIPLAALLVIVPLTAVVDLPGELKAKEILGLHDPDCTRVEGDGPAGEWRSLPSLGRRRDEPRAVTLDGDIYLAGGLDSDDPPQGRSSARFERFDPRTGEYERLPDLPVPLDHLGLAAVGDELYVLGGMSATERGLEATPRAFRFSTSAGTWEEIEPMRHPRGGHGVAVVGSRIYVVGGRPVREFGRARNVAEVEALDVRTGRWEERAPMPEAREHLGVAALGGRVYAYAGRLPDGSVSSRLDRYDPESDSWARVEDGPLATSGIALVPLGGELYTGGGEEPRSVKVFGGAAAYDPGEDRWRTMPNLPEPLHGYAAAAAGERVYLFAGSTCPGFNPTSEARSASPAP